jgi:hypothetical protein
MESKLANAAERASSSAAQALQREFQGAGFRTELTRVDVEYPIPGLHRRPA